MKRTVFLLAMIMATLLGCQNEPKEPKEPPNAYLEVDGKKIDLTKGGYQWEIGKGVEREVTVADTASPDQIAENLAEIKVKNEARVVFSDESEPQIIAFLWEKDKRTSELLTKGQTIEFPKEKGTYVIELGGSWDNGDCTYVMKVKVE